MHTLHRAHKGDKLGSCTELVGQGQSLSGAVTLLQGAGEVLHCSTNVRSKRSPGALHFDSLAAQGLKAL